MEFLPSVIANDVKATNEKKKDGEREGGRENEREERENDEHSDVNIKPTLLLRNIAKNVRKSELYPLSNLCGLISDARPKNFEKFVCVDGKEG